ncbi:MAG: VCBS repeat-containing protein, partial [Armatimonadota bacterium]
SGFVSAAPWGPGRMNLLSAARRRGQYLLYPDVGAPGRPRIGEPTEIRTTAGPIALGETCGEFAKSVPSRIIPFDLDGDGAMDLIIGTDFWEDYWPDGKRWGDREYVPYDADGGWRGGPLRGHVFWLRNIDTNDEPRFAPPQMVRSQGTPVEVYGTASPILADFRGTGRADLVVGDFLDRLHFFPAADTPAEFGPGSPARNADGGELILPQNIHLGCADDWDGDGRTDVLVGAEDGYIYFCRNAGREFGGVPAFHEPARVQQTSPRLNAGSCAVPAVGDLNGDGLPDLVVGNAAGHLLYYRNLGEPGRPLFDKEVYLRAGGEVIRIQAGYNGSIQGPSEAKWGYTCPVLLDWDGDGLLDILISDIYGHHTWYRNVGTPTEPAFAPGAKLTCRGQPLVTVWRVRPAVGDLFGNGVSYICLDENALLAAYHRAGETELVDKSLLRFADGQPIGFTEEHGGGRGRMKFRLCDWTENGLPDLLVGTHRNASIPPGPEGIPRHDINQATVLLLENVGRPGEPAFAAPRYVLYKGKPIRLGIHSCAPEVVDWGDGERGLIVGAESGTLLDMRREHLTW